MKMDYDHSELPEEDQEWSTENLRLDLLLMDMFCIQGQSL